MRIQPCLPQRPVVLSADAALTGLKSGLNTIKTDHLQVEQLVAAAVATFGGIGALSEGVWVLIGLFSCCYHRKWYPFSVVSQLARALDHSRRCRLSSELRLL